MLDYIVNVIAEVIPGDSPYQQYHFSTHRVKADTERQAANRAVREVAKENRPIDTMTIKRTTVIPLDDMPVLHATTRDDD